MATWRALGPLSILLQRENLICDDIAVRKYEADELEKLLGDDKDYWSHVNFSLRYKQGYWLVLDLEVDSGEDAWNKAVAEVRLFLEALGLFKSTLGILALGGLRVAQMVEGKRVGGNFGWEQTIKGTRYYALKSAEHEDFRNLLTKYRKFWFDNRISVGSSNQLKRINLARIFFLKSYQTKRLDERHIFLSVSLEALYGGLRQELKYRYSNRAALLLGDDVERRETVYSEVQQAYDTRSDILHGRTNWIVEARRILTYSEIIRQTILRSISLHMRGYQNIGEALDECLHNSEKHARLLRDSKEVFGSLSNYKEPEELTIRRGWSIR